MRRETDSIGMMEVPEKAYYGVQTLRAKMNFCITGKRLHPLFIRNMAKIKKAAAKTNYMAGDLDAVRMGAICKACDEIIQGQWADEFIVDPIQGGAGTSANMNANEVIANRANELLGGKLGVYDRVHPNDDVNRAQSTNDVIPTAGKLTVLDLIPGVLAELSRLEEALEDKAVEFAHILKMGRTQMQDAVPMTLGQSFHAYASVVNRDIRRIRRVSGELYSVNMGGTAIGSAINVSPMYLSHIVGNLAELSGYPLKQAEDLFDGTQNLDGFVQVSNTLKTCAVNLSKMCNDLRLLSSGPKTGFSEINLPAMQNGSSIMPGKVNPVIPEVVTQVAYHIIGHDCTITMAAEAGQLELNAFEPVLFYNLFESLDTLTGAVKTLVDHCICGITANEKHCRELVESSVGIVTALCPYIGYKKAADIAKEALKTGTTVEKLVLEHGLMNKKEMEEVLNPQKMTGNQEFAV